jgi:hypothetical protein
MLLVLLTPTKAIDPRTVKNKAYDFWVSQSFAFPPYPPFHDCIRFPVNQVCLDGCGDCGAFSETKLGNSSLTLWRGTVPCGGLNLVFTGTSFDGNLLPTSLGADVLGGIGIGTKESTTFAVHGVANPTCSISGSTTNTNINPYSVAAAKRQSNEIQPK